MKPRLWVVSELYFPEQTSTGYFLTHIAEGLAEHYEVRVISGPPTYSERGIDAPRREYRHDVEIFRTRSSRFAKDAALGRITNLVSFTLAASWLAIRHMRNGDRLLLVTNPPTLPLPLGLIARVKRMPAVLLAHDVYPEVLVATGHIGAGGWIDRMLGQLARRTYALYDMVVVLGRDMHEVVGRRVRDRSRLAIIPNWGDVDEVRPDAAAGRAFRVEHGVTAATVIQFSGNIGRTHDVDAVLGAAEALDGRPDIAFLFVGQGGKAALADRASRGSAGSIVFLPRQPRESLAAMLASATATVIPFVDAMYGVSVPSRMYNVMAAGVPIIAMADSRSELALVVAEEGCGWVLPAGDAVGLAALARHLATPDGAREAAERGGAGRLAVERRYRREQMVARFAAALAKLR